MAAASHDQNRLIRQVRQQLEALRRAGLDRIAVSSPVEPVEQRPASAQPILPRPDIPQEPAPIPVTALPIAAGSLFDNETTADPVVPLAERPEALKLLAAEVAGCQQCELLARTRTQTVFGEGNPGARLMFVGEAPGEQEDLTGRPFVGRAGQLLTDMITKGMGLAREDVYIANILKSRPPGNRDPLPDEIRHCLPFLERQIAIIRPEYLCLLGKPAASTLLDTAMPLGRLRGKWHRYRGIPTVVTWHPAYLLRNPAAKKDTWEDLQMLMSAMGIAPRSRKSD